LHEAAVLGDLDIVKALLERNADPDLESNNSIIPLDISVAYTNFPIMLALINSKKISKANLEKARLKANSKPITLLAYANLQAAQGGNDKASWETIVNALQAAGATQ
jgi:ankyrin repeat protein